MLKSLLDGLKALVVKPAGREEEWDYGERRELIRLECMFDIDGKTQSGKKFKGQIVDMGMKGMKLRTFEQVKRGETLLITYPVPILEIPMDTVSCKVAWTQTRSRDYVMFAGLLYAEDEKAMARSWIKYLLKQLGFSREKIFQKRKYVRAECFVPARMRYGGDRPVEGKLYNLGVGGALIDAAAPLQVGMDVELTIGPYEELPEFTVTGKLATRREEARRFLHGVEFQQLDDPQARAMGKYLFLLLRQQWTE